MAEAGVAAGGGGGRGGGWVARVGCVGVGVGVGVSGSGWWWVWRVMQNSQGRTEDRAQDCPTRERMGGRAKGEQPEAWVGVCCSVAVLQRCSVARPRGVGWWVLTVVFGGLARVSECQGGAWATTLVRRGRRFRRRNSGEDAWKVPARPQCSNILVRPLCEAKRRCDEACTMLLVRIN